MKSESPVRRGNTFGAQQARVAIIQAWLRSLPSRLTSVEADGGEWHGSAGCLKSDHRIDLGSARQYYRVPQPQRRVPAQFALIGCAAPALGVMACLAASAQASPPPPTALVEQVSAPVAGATTLGYLTAGATLDLGAGTTIVLDYLGPCVRETISGGTVTVGVDQSQVHGGHVSRRRLDCDGGDLQVAATQSEQGAVAEYRAIGDASALVVHSTVPLVLPGGVGAGRLVIQRLDRSDTDIGMDIPPVVTGHPALDLGTLGRALAAGGKYRATLGQRSVVFTVDQAAGGKSAPLLARLLPI